MSIHQTEKIGPYFFAKTTFQLLNLEMHPSFQAETTSLNSISHLSRLLKSKNGALRTSTALRSKQSSKHEMSIATQQGQLEWKVMDEITIKINDQLERIRSLMRERQIKDKHNLKNKSYLDDQQFKQLIKNQGTSKNTENLCAYFSELGQLKAAKLAEELQLYGESCQSYQELLHTFRHIILDDQPSTIFSSKVAAQKNSYLNISQYGQLFQQMLAFRKKRSQQNYAQTFLDEFYRVKLPESIQNNQFYKNIEHQLKITLKKQKTINNKYTFSDFQRLIRFLNLQPVPQKYSQVNDPLTYEILWQKLDDLIRRGPVHHSMIKIHLSQFKQKELYNFFNATLNGKFQNFNKNLALFESNYHYRNFVQIIERTYSKQLIKQNNPINKQVISGVIKELILRINLKQNIQNPLKLIRQYTIKLSEKLKIKARKVSSYSQIKTEVRELICLGDISELIEIITDSQKMNFLEALLILIQLTNVNIKSSEFLFFNSQPIETLYNQLIGKILKIQLKQGFRQMTLFLKLFANLLPFEKVLTSNHLIDMLTYNKNLFDFIILNQQLTEYLSHFNLSFNNFSEILQQFMQKHSNYCYCMELTLSFLIPISQYIQICYPKSKTHKNISSSQGRIIPFSDQLHCKTLQKFQFVDRTIGFSQRFKLLINIIKLFQKVNIELSKNKVKRQTFYDQISFCNEMYSHLSKKHITDILFKKWDIPKNQISQHLDQLTKQLTNLTFTFNLLKVRYYIVCSRFEEMVDLFNQFLQKICPQFPIILNSMQILLKEDQAEELGLMYLGQIIQCLLVLKQSKIKVISKNRYLFKVLCNNISELLKGIKATNKEDAQLIKAQIKQILNEIITL